MRLIRLVLLALLVPVPAVAQTPLTLTTLPSITIQSPDGQPVVMPLYTPPIADGGTPYVPPGVVCDHAPGTVLPLGDTTVVCAVTDAAGVVAQSAFTVTVQPPLLFNWAQQASYLGFFKLPPGGALGYPGFGLAYDEQRNGLFITGSGQRATTSPCEKVGEITIPAVGGVASWLQPLTDVTEGKCRQADVTGTPTKLGSYAVDGGALCGVNFAFYDAASIQRKSAWCRSSDLSVLGTVTDLVGLTFTEPTLPKLNPTRYTNATLVAVPPEYQAALGGPFLVGTGNSNIVAGTSNGPAAFGWTPGTNAVQPLFYFPVQHPLDFWKATSNLWNGSTVTAGGVIVGGSLVWFHAQGVGPFCYGPGSTCGDPENAAKGDHAYPYQFRVDAYRLADLQAFAAAGTPWLARPYGSWDLGPLAPARKHMLLGVAYDWAGKRLFLSQGFADGDRAVMHVFQIGP